VTPIALDTATVYGRVKSITGREFTLETGLNTQLVVDTSDLIRNPLDNKGYLKLKSGDYVRVSGEIKSSFFKDYKLNAKSIVKYYNL